MPGAADREERVLAWLRGLGSGPFTYRQVAEATGMTRDQAMIACLSVSRSGQAEIIQLIGDWGTHRFLLRRA